MMTNNDEIDKVFTVFHKVNMNVCNKKSTLLLYINNEETHLKFKSELKE